MSRKAYKENINQLLETIDSVLQTKSILPSLILIYSGIDIMAWLSRDKSHQDNTRSDFKDWVNVYLLPDSGLNCNADDLYAARCSILHSYTSESKMSREGEAREIYYAWGTADRRQFQKYIDISSKRGKGIVLSVDTLNSAFKTAIERFNKASNKNTSLSKLVSKRAAKFFVVSQARLYDNQVLNESA